MLFCHNSKIDVIRALLGKIWKRTILLWLPLFWVAGYCTLRSTGILPPGLPFFYHHVYRYSIIRTTGISQPDLQVFHHQVYRYSTTRSTGTSPTGLTLRTREAPRIANSIPYIFMLPHWVSSSLCLQGGEKLSEIFSFITAGYDRRGDGRMLVC